MIIHDYSLSEARRKKQYRRHVSRGAIESDAEIESVRQAAFRLLPAQYSSH